MIHNCIAADNTVTMQLTERGTHDGEFMGIEPTGKEFEIQTTAFFHLEEGRSMTSGCNGTPLNSCNNSV